MAIKAFKTTNQQGKNQRIYVEGSSGDRTFQYELRNEEALQRLGMSSQGIQHYYESGYPIRYGQGMASSPQDILKNFSGEPQVKIKDEYYKINQQGEFQSATFNPALGTRDMSELSGVTDLTSPFPTTGTPFTGEKAKEITPYMKAISAGKEAGKTPQQVSQQYAQQQKQQNPLKYPSTPPSTAQGTTQTQGQSSVAGFPKNQEEMKEWQQKYKFDKATGQWKQPSDGVTEAGSEVPTVEKIQADLNKTLNNFQNTLNGSVKTGGTEDKTAVETEFDDFKGDLTKKLDDFKDLYSDKLTEISNLGQSSINALTQYRQDQGLPQMESMVAKMDVQILNTEELLENIEADINQRTEGLPVTEAASRRLLAMEGKPLNKQLSNLVRDRARLSAGLEQKQAVVEQYQEAQQSDIDRQTKIMEAELGLEKEFLGVEADLLAKEFDVSVGEIEYLRSLPAEQLSMKIKEAELAKALLPDEVKQTTN